MLGLPKHTAILEMKAQPPATFPDTLKKFSLQNGLLLERITIHPGPTLFISLKLSGKSEEAINFLNRVVAAFRAYIQKAVLNVEGGNKKIYQVKV